MRWSLGTNPHIIQDAEGEYVATAKTEDFAAQIVNNHNETEFVDHYAEETIERLLGEDSELRKAFLNLPQQQAFMAQVDEQRRLVKPLNGTFDSTKGWTNKL